MVWIIVSRKCWQTTDVSGLILQVKANPKNVILTAWQSKEGGKPIVEEKHTHVIEAMKSAKHVGVECELK